ncbi:MAG: hypothetical protein WAM30_10700, partial [Candidatus Dormiibacterota bacterium]
MEIARANEAAVVVSMHDLGWVCERGTCVDAKGESCIPAVAPGSCACQRGTRALAERNTRLREALDSADHVLGPSVEGVHRLRASGLRGCLELDPFATGDPPRELIAASLVRVYDMALAHRRAPRHAAAERANQSRRVLPRRVLLIVGAEGPPLHYRVHQKVEQLALHGVDATVRWYADPRIARDLTTSDAVIVYRAPATQELVAHVRAARGAGVPTFYDVDDLVFDPELADEIPIHGRRSRPERDEWVQTAHRYAAMLTECGAGIASTPEIARHMVRMGVPAYVHRNGVDSTLAVVSERARRRRRRTRDVRASFTVGYCSGTDTHDADLALIGDALEDFLAAHPGARLVLMGPLRVPPALDRHRARIVQLEWVPEAAFPDQLAALDLNLAPLVE